MWFVRASSSSEQSPQGTQAAGLTLGELVAMRPRHVRESSASGERFPTGMRPGRHRAQGLDLDGISPYAQGDDVRRIDWRATARTGRTQMKRYLAESHRAKMLIVDLRPGLFFGTRDRLMAKTAALAAARLAWESLGLHEPVGLITLPDLDRLRPRRGRSHLLRLLDQLEKGYLRKGAGSQGDLSRALEVAAAHLRYGDEVCCLSDFGERDANFGETSRALSGLRQLRAFVVEDGIFTQPVPPGRYPIRRPAGAGHEVASLSRRGAAQQGEVVAALRRALSRDLIELGWRPSNASDLVPRIQEPLP